MRAVRLCCPRFTNGFFRYLIIVFTLVRFPKLVQFISVPHSIKISIPYSFSVFLKPYIYLSSSISFSLPLSFAFSESHSISLVASLRPYPSTFLSHCSPFYRYLNFIFHFLYILNDLNFSISFSLLYFFAPLNSICSLTIIDSLLHYTSISV